MDKTRVYFVRHGETEGNVSNYYQTAETPLTQKGIAQAKSIAERLKNHGVDLIYSSPHVRAVNTSEVISKELNVPIEKWEKLTEIRRPKEIKGKPANDPDVIEIEKRMIENFGTPDRRISDEENFFDVHARGFAVLEHLAQKHKGETVVCVSHGTFIKVLVATILLQARLTPEIFDYIRHHLFAENTGLSVAEYSEEKNWKLLTWNDVSHL